MRLALLFMFAAMAAAQNFPTITIIPTSDDSATNMVRYRELRANGLESVGFRAAASIAADVTWTLPVADAAGCWQSDGAGTMTIASCGGLSGPIDELIFTNDNRQKIRYAGDGTNDFGVTLAAGDLQHHSQYSTQKLSWGYGGPVAFSQVFALDFGNNEIVADMPFTGAGGVVTFKGSILPTTDNLYDIGLAGINFRHASFDGLVTAQDLTVLGTCTNCGTAPANMMTTDTAQTVTGQKTFTQAILFTNDNLQKLRYAGDGLNDYGVSLAAGDLRIYTQFNTQRVSWGFGAPASWDPSMYMDHTRLDIKNLRIASDTGSISFEDHLIPSSDNTYDIGLGGINFRNASFDGTMTAQNVTVLGTCTGCGDAPANMVTTDTAQTITGQKTFSVAILMPSTNGEKMRYAGGSGNAMGVSVATNDLRYHVQFSSQKHSWGYGAPSAWTEAMYMDNTRLDVKNLRIASNTGAISFEDHLIPSTDNLYDIGLGGINFRHASFDGDLSYGGSLFVGTSNFYNRNYAGTANCSGVADGWTGIDTTSNQIEVCIGGVTRTVNLN